MDVRKSLPLGVNDRNMNERGERSGPLSIYGNEFDQKSVYAAFEAWGVVSYYLTNKTTSFMYDGIPTISREGGPRYVLLFGDGKWREASFGGINGPPWFRCGWEGVEAPNGEAAHLMFQLERRIKNRESLEVELKNTSNDVAELKARLASAMKKPK